MDLEIEKNKIQAVAARAKVRDIVNGFNEKLDDCAGLLAESYPRRTRVSTEKGVADGIETRDIRRKNHDRYRYITEGHNVRIHHMLKTNVGINMIDELLVKVIQSNK